MTVQEAIETLRSAGPVEVAGERIRCRVPKSRSPAVETALRVIRERKSDAMQWLKEKTTLEEVLKGTAIALYCDVVSETLWIVADEEDARLLAERRGVVYTADEVRLIASIDNDPEIIRSVHEFKSTFNVAVKPPGENR